MSKHVLVIYVLIALIVGFGTYYSVKQSAKLDDQVQSITDKVEQAIKIDSLKNLQERLILDSLREVRDDLQGQINQVKSTNDKLSRQNAALTKKYNSLPDFNRPDF